jgi:NADPH:quinone reductase
MTAPEVGTRPMRAGVLAAPQTLRTEQRDCPEPGAGEVRIRLEGCGVCGSNLPVWQGRPWFAYPQEPGAPGHEGWGTIDALGPGVRGLAVGLRVAALSYHAYAEYDLAAASAVVPIPPALGGQPVPGEPLGCALNVFRRADIQPGQTVAIVGVGFLGALLTQLAARAGARVLAISRRPSALEVARSCGAAEALALDERTESLVERLTGGRWCDRVIEAVGLQAPLDLAGRITRERGRLVIAGFHQDGPRQVDLGLWNWRGLDVVNAHERDPQVYVAGIRDALALVAGGLLDPAPLYTHRFPLAELGAALRAAAERPAGFMKALVLA